MPSEKQILKDLNDRWDLHQEYWRENWNQGDIDMRYANGDPWPIYEKTARSQPGQERPMLVFDECGQYIQEAINQLRANKRAVKVLPAPGRPGQPLPSDDEAQLRGARIRAIEYKWNAQNAYMTAAENAIRRGMGYWRIGKRRISPDSFDQEITIKPIPNSRTVSLDPDAEQVTFSDMKDAFIFQQYTEKQFKKLWPKAAVTSFDAIDAEIAMSWVHGSNIQVAEYWCIKGQSKRLLLIESPDGQEERSILEEELEETLTQQGGYSRDGKNIWTLVNGQPYQVGIITRDEKTEIPQVYQYLTNGVELLEEPVLWDGKYIPIVPIFGPQYWVRGADGLTQRQVESLVRKARDPIMLLCYIRSTMAELIGSAPKTPYIGYEGQFLDPNWQFINKSNIVKLEVPVIPDGSNGTLPLPQRQPISIPVGELEIAAEAARRAIQSAMGLSSLPTQAQRRNEKSGVALQAIEDKQQQGRFHLVDAVEGAITQSGRIISDLLSKVEDTPRDIQIRNEDDEAQVIRLNEPFKHPETGEQTDHKFTDGEFDVVITTGPEELTSKQQASDFADTLLASPFGPRIADIAVKLKEIDPVIREQLATRLTPPDIAAQEAQGKPDPAVLQAQNQQLQQALQAVNAHAQQVEAELQEAKSGIAAKQIEGEFKLKDRTIQARTAVETALIQKDATIEAARIRESGSLTNEAMKQDGETARTHLRGMHEAGRQAAEHEHAEEMAEAEPEEAAEVEA